MDFPAFRQRRCHGAARGLIKFEAQSINGVCIPPYMCLKINEGVRTFTLVTINGAISVVSTMIVSGATTLNGATSNPGTFGLGNETTDVTTIAG